MSAFFLRLPCGSKSTGFPNAIAKAVYKFQFYDFVKYKKRSLAPNPSLDAVLRFPEKNSGLIPFENGETLGAAAEGLRFFLFEVVGKNDLEGGLDGGSSGTPCLIFKISSFGLVFIGTYFF